MRHGARESRPGLLTGRLRRSAVNYSGAGCCELPCRELDELELDIVVLLSQ